jgi:hypothetical protein
MSTVTAYTSWVAERNAVLQDLAKEQSEGRMDEAATKAFLLEWDTENPNPGKGNAARDPAPAQNPTAPDKPKATLMVAPNAKSARDEILMRVASGTLKAEDAAKELDRVEKATRRGLYCKVSAKGACSLYGLQRMPVTLYVEQWERVLAFADELRGFMKEHDAELSRKPAKA